MIREGHLFEDMRVIENEKERAENMGKEIFRNVRITYFYYVQHSQHRISNYYVM